jgi:hypothetical protein
MVAPLTVACTGAGASGIFVKENIHGSQPQLGGLDRGGWPMAGTTADERPGMRIRSAVTSEAARPGPNLDMVYQREAYGVLLRTGW